MLYNIIFEKENERNKTENKEKKKRKSIIKTLQRKRNY